MEANYENQKWEADSGSMLKARLGYTTMYVTKS